MLDLFFVVEFFSENNIVRGLLDITKRPGLTEQWKKNCLDLNIKKCTVITFTMKKNPYLAS